MTPTDIKKLLQKGERLTLEAKLAKTDVPKSLWESYSAFANTMGGTILLGVFEDVKEKQHMKMQNMLRMIGYVENLGSGFPLILNAWKQAGWGEPELKNRLEVDEVALVLPIPNKTNDEANDRLSDGLNDRLNGSLMATYTIVRSNPGIQRKDISDISGKSIPTIDRHIAILMKKGLIEHRDSKKTGGYYAK